MVRRTDGRSVTVEATDPIGSPEKPLSDNQLEAKFRDCARNAMRPLSDASVDAALGAIARLETLADGRELLARRSPDDWLGFPITAGKYVYCEWPHADPRCPALVRRTDGRSVTVEATDPIGSPEKPLSDNQLEAKFRDCARNAMRLLSDASVDAALGAIARLETLADGRELLAPFAG